MDNYHPALLYSDGPVLFGNEVGLSLIADLYNDSLRHNHGKLTAVYTCKQSSDGRGCRTSNAGLMAASIRIRGRRTLPSATGFTIATGNTSR